MTAQTTTAAQRLEGVVHRYAWGDTTTLADPGVVAAIAEGAAESDED